LDDLFEDECQQIIDDLDLEEEEEPYPFSISMVSMISDIDEINQDIQEEAIISPQEIQSPTHYEISSISNSYESIEKNYYKEVDDIHFNQNITSMQFHQYNEN
jgi:hypothetical protein